MNDSIKFANGHLEGTLSKLQQININENQPSITNTFPTTNPVRRTTGQDGKSPGLATYPSFTVIIPRVNHYSVVIVTLEKAPGNGGFSPFI